VSAETVGSRRVAVVTGGAGAIGGAIAARLAVNHTVVVLDRTGDVPVDLGDPADVRRSAQLVLDRYGRCDVLVHSAAMVAFGPFEDFELDLWRQVQAVNVESALLLTQVFAPEMRERGFGRVVFTSERGGWQADLPVRPQSGDHGPRRVGEGLGRLEHPSLN
jgi:NAD(P)-dependent dehydrogenase (short-subunit alcohol dehydrogenase family)